MPVSTVGIGARLRYSRELHEKTTICRSGVTEGVRWPWLAIGRKIRGSYKNAAARLTARTTTFGTATAIPAFELLWVLPVWVGVGEPVELEWEEDDEIEILLLLPGRPEDEREGREERPEEEDTGRELPALIREPLPQGILSPFG